MPEKTVKFAGSEVRVCAVRAILAVRVVEHLHADESGGREREASVLEHVRLATFFAWVEELFTPHGRHAADSPQRLLGRVVYWAGTHGCGHG